MRIPDRFFYAHSAPEAVLAKASFNKPWLTVGKQIELLRSRGLVINDQGSAEQFLYHFNYYRFTGYCIAFENSRHIFQDGVTFDDVQAACQFDAALRDLFTEALELIEIDVRTATSHRFGEKYGAFGHVAPTSFHRKFDQRTTHSEWLTKLQGEILRSGEKFVTHFKENYLEFPNLPIWATTEVMSFGSLSRMIGGMQKGDRQLIANQYSLVGKVFSSLTHHLTHVRNLCAHHCRLWDRKWSIKITLPNTRPWSHPNTVSNDSIFSTILLMRQILTQIPHAASEADQWRDRVTNLLLSPPPAVNANKRMGLTERWQRHPVWR